MNDPRKTRITVSVEEQIKELFDIMKLSSKDKDIIGKLAYGLLKERLYYFLDEIDCDLSRIDVEVKHFMTRVDCGIYTRQFEQAISKNKLKGGKHE